MGSDPGRGNMLRARLSSCVGSTVCLVGWIFLFFLVRRPIAQEREGSPVRGSNPSLCAAARALFGCSPEKCVCQTPHQLDFVSLRLGWLSEHNCLLRVATKQGMIVDDKYLLTK